MLLGLLVVAQGCGVRPPTPKEQQAVQEQSKSIVFLRLPIKSHLRLAKVETGLGSKIVQNISPSSEAKIEGWYYFVLEPGVYCLSVLDNADPRSAKKVQDFWLEVDKGRPLLYAGTLSLGMHRGAYTEVKVTDEPEAARAFAASAFAGYGEPAASLVRPVGGEPAPDGGRDLMPLGVAATCGANLVSPQWVKRGATRLTGLDQESGGSALGALGGGGPGAGALAAGVLLYLATATTLGAVHGLSQKKRFQPCVQDLINEIQEMDLAARLRRELGDQLGKHSKPAPVILAGDGDFYAQAARQLLKTVLHTDLRRIQIRECQQRGAFAVEIVLWCRLLDVAGEKAVRQLALVYTNIAPYHSGSGKLEHEVRTWKSSTCRKMQDYCGPEGRQLFREEVAVGLRYLVEKLMFEVGILQRKP